MSSSGSSIKEEKAPSTEDDNAPKPLSQTHKPEGDDVSSYAGSIQSYENGPEQTHPEGERDVESQNIESQLSRHVTNILSETNGAERIESLARVLSTKTKKQLEHFEIREGIDFDLQQLLDYLRSHQLDQGIVPGDAGVAFKDLTAVGIDASAAVAPSVGEMVRGWVHHPLKMFNRKKTDLVLRNIIQNFTSVIESGEMMLVIARPGAGASTLLKCIGGETSELVEVTGEFSYDGLDQHDMMSRFKGYVIYCPELDFHFPKITVKETIDFALRCKTPRVRIDGMSRKEYVDSMRDLWCTVFGLRHTYATNVGNDQVRGVSGGERKRVSLVEAIAMNGSIICWDNATRGLDASTALEFAQAIRTATNMTNTAAIVCIYQAGQNIFELFDKVTVIYNGKQIYMGPAEEGVEYFTNMGWVKPNRMTSPEFLTSVTLDYDNRVLDVKPGFEASIPKNSDEFLDYWVNSPQYAKNLGQYDEYVANHNAEETRQRLAESIEQRKQAREPLNSLYVVNYWHQVWYCMIRGVQRVKGDTTYTIVYLSSFLTKGFFVGSMFWRIDPIDQSTTEGAYSRGGLIFYVLLFCSLTSLAEISNSFANRGIIVKHKTYSMYHTSAEALQEIFTEMPVKFVAVLVLCLISYWLPALKWQAGSFFQYLLYMFTVQQCTSFIFKLCATLTKDGGTAHAVGGLWVLMLSLAASFFLPIGQMHHWIRWFHYINPLTYAFESVMSTEFHGRQMLCSKLIPSGTNYENVSIENQVCQATGAVKGQRYVSGDTYLKKAYHFEYKHAWRDWGINVVWTFGYIIMNVIMSEYLKPLEGGGDLLLYKRGFMPSFGDNADAKVASREEMMEALNGPNVDLDEVIASKDVFTWNNLTYTIPYDGSTRVLLNSVFGYVKPGKMTALMGESGAGKTTLLNTLAQRIRMGTITGDMLVNNKPLPASFKRSCGYVAQADNHMAELTVRESLKFAAELRQPASVPLDEKMDYVEKIIRLLGMQNYAEATVGKIGRGLNVEQRKKLSIGVELVAKPSLLLFLDEPTSGLDSQSAWSIVQFMRALADSGQSILCTIHQPSATLFEQFDRLLLLKKGGFMVYFGDIGENSNALTGYFERQSGIKCGVSENPAEYMLNRIGAGATANASSDWHELWENSPECAAGRQELAELHEKLNARPVTEDKELSSRFAVSLFTQFKCVLWRTNIQFWRSPVYIRAKFLECILCALYVGLSYVGTGVDYGVQGAQSSFASTFMMLLIALAMVNQMHVFAYDSRELYEVREADSNTFHWSALLICHTWLEIAWSSICVFICFICYYWPGQFSGRASHAGYWFLIYVIMFPIYFISYGSWIIYMAPDVPSASMINSNLFAMLLLFCGILQPFHKMPGFWTFMYKVSPFTYVVQSLVSSIVHNKKVICNPHEFAILDPPQGQTCEQFLAFYRDENKGYIDNPDATDNCRYCPYTVSDQIVEQYGIRWDQRWRNFGLLWAYIVFNFVAMCVCYYIMRVKVWSVKGILDIKKWYHGPRKERHEPETNVFKEKAHDKKNVTKSKV
ncbi:ATP-dependent permease PDR12 [Hanseniaspora osmophila]|uniref:ATP-dependent permease PDR12 n=1 Tax=Hanseniaspora osmophila TaxID=56408 RepID=A0A1E5R840_9ASCO|nr:ATP-dependent permease PDR12 [Hanseniaspora osmophila]